MEVELVVELAAAIFFLYELASAWLNKLYVRIHSQRNNHIWIIRDPFRFANGGRCHSCKSLLALFDALCAFNLRSAAPGHDSQCYRELNRDNT